MPKYSKLDYIKVMRPFPDNLPKDNMGFHLLKN